MNREYVTIESLKETASLIKINYDGASFKDGKYDIFFSRSRKGEIRLDIDDGITLTQFSFDKEELLDALNQL